jgi:hypothetical protein
MHAKDLSNRGYKIKCNNKNEITIKIEAKRKKIALPNRLSSAKTSDEDIKEREDLIEKSLPMYRKMLPEILLKLSRIKDPRHPSYIKHQMTVLFVYGILCSVFHMSSRRQVNLQMSRGIFIENLFKMFPELKTLPHADTLARFLEDVEDVKQIQDCAIELFKDIVRHKKLQNHLIKNRYVVAIDGTQKQIRDYKYADEALHKEYKDGSKYYVYVVEAIIVLNNGVTLPFMSEILENDKDIQKCEVEKNNENQFHPNNDTKAKTEEEIKQDCENKGFKRVAASIKKCFPNLPITLVLDGLYSNCPIIEICNKNKWEYMIVLKDKSLKEVWREVDGLIRLSPENCSQNMWGNRHQKYTWANHIEYEYQDPKTKRYKTLVLHVVICHETWEEIHSNSTGKTEVKETRYAWISSQEIHENNVFSCCTKIARSRWSIENFILKEKKQGYNYEHFYSYNWNAMKGYHYLMHIGHLINTLAMNSDLLTSKVAELGLRGFVNLFKLCCSGSALFAEKIKAIQEKKYILRLFQHPVI